MDWDIDVYPLSLAFGSSEHRMNVEKRKAERLEAHKAENVEIQRMRPPKPQHGHYAKGTEHHCREHQAIGRSSAEARRREREASKIISLGAAASLAL